MNFTGTVPLETSRLLLRPFAPSDVQDCLRFWAADPSVYRYISQEPMTVDEIEEWLSKAAQAYADPQTFYWAIVTKEQQEVIGELFVDSFSVRNSRCELDWKIGSRFWGNGYAVEAAECVLFYLTHEVGFHRIQAKCCVKNRASERVMQKIGMKKEGLFRDYFYSAEDGWQDVVIYARLA